MQTTSVKRYRLSRQQTRLWHFQEHCARYCAQCTVRLDGEIHREAFLKALQSVLDRHAILRTAFCQVVGMEEPLQEVVDHVKENCVIVNLEGLAEQDRNVQLDASVHLLQALPFHFERTPLSYSGLFHLTTNTHLFHLSLPALCADDASLRQYVTEIARSYAMAGAAFSQDSLQYVDVITWQEELLEDGGNEQGYWDQQQDLSQLAVLQAAKRPGGEAREPVSTERLPFAPRQLDVPLDKDRSDDLQSLAERKHIAVAALLLTCWQLVLRFITGEDHLIVGVACDGRIDEELTDTMGLYTRFVPLATALPPALSGLQTVSIVNTLLQEIWEKQLYFTWEAFQQPAEGKSTPFFAHGFEYVAHPDTLQAGNVRLTLEKSASCSEPYTVKLRASQFGQRLHLTLHYNAATIATEQVQGIAEMLCSVIEGMLAQPEQAIHYLPLVSQQAHATLLQKYQGQEHTLPKLVFHQLFEQQVAVRAAELALTSETEELTYQELNTRANQLAHVLRDRYNVVPGEMVGLCVTRSTAMIVGMLGILKAGGAYMPLDPRTPVARIAYQLHHSGVSVLLTQEALLPHLPAWKGRVLSFEGIEQELAGVASDNLPTISEPQDPAYTIYTSGSTGMPKGVQVRQESIVNYALALCELLGVEPGWSYATVSTLAADLGNTAIFCALLSGGCLHIPGYETITSPEAFASWAIRHPIDVLKIVPSHLLALLAGEHAHALLPRKALVCGGETLPTSLVERVRELGASCALYNHYGPTEATIGVLATALNPQAEDVSKTFPLGRPIANTEVYILGPGRQLLPVGVTGEVYIGGKALAQGYIQDASQTAERFVPHPMSKQAGERLYRTGDLAFLNTSGEIEFVGRNDQQVKLRGYRIELGEIEAVLRAHTNVWSAAVALREDSYIDDNGLVAYVVEQKPFHADSQTLRDYLGQHLPDYMIPNRFVYLEALPLTPNGKIDRKSLPAPDPVRHDERDRDVALPRNPIEELLVEIWTDLLGTKTTDIYDNFFSLGGHSLLATRMIARLREILQVEVALRDLFDAPTIAGLAQRIGEILRQDQHLFVPPLLPTPPMQTPPLSFAQQRLWFLNLLEPRSTAYLLPRARYCLGDLDVAILERSFSEIVRRHEILRTTIHEHAGQPVQCIHPYSALRLPVIDLTGFEQQKREAEARRLIRLDARFPFDLTRGPLQRLNLLRLQPQEHILLLTMHHIISDAWSNAIYMQELAVLYRSFAARQPSPLPPLPVQYADFALWQRHWLQGEVLEQQLAYWKEQLADGTALELPTDRRRPLVQSYRGGLLGASLPPALRQSLLDLCQQEGVTLFMLLLAAFQILLARYSGQEDISVGTPIANRAQQELEGLIGFFVNTLILRCDLSGNPSFLELLSRVREVALGGYAHQDVPFEYLVEELQPERDLSRHPLFQIMFGVQQMEQSSDHMDKVTVRTMNTEHSVTKFDMTFNVVSSAQGLFCSVEYSTDLFDVETIQQLLVHWHRLLEEIVAHPQKRIFDLPLLSEPEVKVLLHDWNDTTRETSPASIHELFTAQAARNPDAIAVMGEESCLSFAALEQYSNQLARHLRNQGIETESLVGVALERTPALPICVLAISKAGGGYVPLDPEYPLERLELMVNDAHLSAIITSSALAEAFSWENKPLLFFETFWLEIARLPETIAMPQVDSDNIAYVIFTSGSTGHPKGVLVSHRGIHNLVQEQMSAFAVQGGSRVLQFASLSFDASIWEMVMALLSGGCLCIVAPQQLLPGPGLLELLRTQAITVLTIPPSALAATGYSELPDLATLIVAGEACSAELVERWAPGRHFWNAYGPTEATVCASMAECFPGVQKPDIGQPIANTRVYAVDASLQLVPVRVPGDLLLGGCGLARGYLNRPDLTAERFLPDPLSLQAGARLYHTGDRVRHLRNGHLDFLGRNDQQVKVRGYRIELREIEIVLSRHSLVRESVILVDEDSQGDPRLIAYVAAGEAYQTLNSLDLRHYLQNSLPDYMIPSHIVLLDTFPLTPNGKIDKRALASLATAHQETEDTIDEVLTPIEGLLMNIWLDILGDEQIKLTDNFFNLGGHSLLATQVIARVQAIFQVDVPLQVMFETPTIAGLAQQVTLALSGAQVQDRAPLIAVERTQSLPLSFAQQRLWFLHQLEPASSAYLLPLVRRLRGTLVLACLEQSLNTLVERHEILRTTFPVRDTLPSQIVHPATTLSWPLIDLSALSGSNLQDEWQRLRKQESQRPCDLACGPLLRLAVLRLAHDEHILLLTMHHIISDGWSHEILFQELTTIYEAVQSGQHPALPDLPIQYADFALWQRQWLQGEVLEAQLNYWQDCLAGIQPLDLPIDRPRPALQTFQGAQSSLVLPAALQERLLELSREHDVTLFMLLLAAFNVLLFKYTGQEDISIGTPIANRSQTEVEGLIGFFVNTLILRNDLTGNPTFQQLLTRVRRKALEAYAHQDMPFEYLVECLQPVRDLSRSPLFQVMFSQQQSVREREGTRNRAFQNIDAEHVTAKFDLTLHVMSSMQGLYCSVEYNTDLFEAETIKRLLAHWQVLLNGIALAPQTPLADLPVLEPREMQALLSQGHATQKVFQEIASIHDLIAARVDISPDAVAISYKEEQVTYRELNARANKLAAYLRQQGIGAEMLVALSLERRPELLVGMLGVLKAKAGYLLLDPSAPLERLTFLLEDAHAALLVTMQHTSFPSSQPTLFLDMQWLQIDASREEDGERFFSQDTLAYVCYTSGSTGRPKGVQITHRSLLNHCQTISASFKLEGADRVLQFAAPGFDVIGEEIFPTLACGGTLVFCLQESIGSFTEFWRCIDQEQLTVLNLPSPYWQQWVLDLAASQANLPGSLRLLVAGSEKVLPERLTLWYQLSTKHIRWCNAYGPTEATVTATIYEASPGSYTTVPIGKPLANITAYVLDRSLRPVPAGVWGELYLGGAGVARGYLHHPDLTAAHFLPDPFSEHPGSRLYQTGDRVRALLNGQMVIQGRSDRQVKVRGYRIEPGEIERALAGHAQVQDCAVQVHKDAEDNAQIVAYVVSQDASLTNEDLRNYLRATLPGYMIPSAFFQLEHLPLMVSGKIDYQALPDPRQFWKEEQSTGSAPRTAVETFLTEIWSDVLGGRQIGIHDNFFVSGGHSLLAAQVISRLRAVFQVELPLWRLFEDQTIAELAPSIEQLLRDGSADVLAPIQLVPRTQDLELSFAQQRLWLIDQLEAGMTAYLIPSARRLSGALDTAVLERSLETLIERHESLRTTFVVKHERPVQIIHPVSAYCLPVVDLRTFPVEQATLIAQSLAWQEAQQPCDLERGPLFRCMLLRTQMQEHVLLITMHHIISDAWSDEVFVHELLVLYHAFLDGAPSPLPALPIQYADFAAWQREWLRGATFERSVDYWRQQLVGSVPLDLPTDYPRPERPTFRGAFASTHFPASVVAKLTERCRQNNVTQFMFLLAVFLLLLVRYTEQMDISIGTPIANRTRKDLEGLLGFFINTLVLRVRVARESTFQDILAQVRQIALEAYAHQDVPFEQLVEAVQPERDLSRSPLFQIMFGVQHAAPSSLTAEPAQNEIKSSNLESQHTITKFDLTFSVASSVHGLRCGAEYNRDLFTASTIHRLLTHWEQLLEEVLEAPETPIMEFSLLSAAERQQLLVEWNDTSSETETEFFWPTLFAEQATRTPDAIAVIGEDTCLSFAALDQQANQLAHILVERGVAPEILVGIAIEPSALFVLSVLAVLKAGGGYVPLDLSYPPERLEIMFTDAQVTLLIHADALPPVALKTTVTTLSLNQIWSTLLHVPCTVPLTHVQRDNLAYVIYTSGSTGRPKGVAVTHRGIENLARAQARAFAVSRTSRVLQCASLSFDASISEIAVTLLAGASLTLVPRQWLIPGEDFLTLLRERAITVMTLPPSILTALPWAELPTLATLVVAGEPCPAFLVERWARGRTFLNAYGPTETTVCASLGECIATGLKPAIGKPIARTQLYVLDARLQLVPVGVPGELYISGAGLARGYLQRADLTAQQFIPHPFSIKGGERLYRSGDRVRYHADGTLEYLGRSDQQIKLRGYRIELTEIETALLRHPAIQEAVVVMREDSPGDQRLVAYIVPGAEEKCPDAHELRSYLQARLPDYMIPSHFIALAEIPLTVAKKIDRRSLAAPEKKSGAGLQKNSAGYTPVERTLLGLWREILEDDQLDIDDDFFDAGGHSLLAARLIMRIKDTFQVALPLHDIFNAPTVEALAATIEQHHTALLGQAEDAELEHLLSHIESLPEE